MRYAWNPPVGEGSQSLSRKILFRLLAPFRAWDRAAVERVDRLASVSRMTASQVQAVYKRESTLIYPPVEVERFTPQPGRESYYITVSRLVAHKRVDLIVRAFNRLGLPLLVIGEGPQRLRLERLAQPNVRFLGFQPDTQVAHLLNQARGFMCAASEDFGIAVVEAQAAGCPVIAYRAGGALETIIEGETGLFFAEQTAESLAAAVEAFEKCRLSFCPDRIAASVQRFNSIRFLREFAQFCEMV
jgi:glycosyltransferase involved in cell wall biosynthesis